jgi:hypothetical protein
VFAIGGGITLLAAVFAWTLFRRAPLLTLEAGHEPEAGRGASPAAA